jgi:iron complex transport system ATP-binding protein
MLKVNHLTCGYDSGFAIRDINMDVKRGEMIAVIGPNGCGKTTLLRAITGALKPAAGTILLQDRDMRKMPPAERARNIAVVSQNLEAAPMTVEDFVLLGRIPYFKKFQFMETEKDHEIALEAMELTDSLRFKDHLVEQISGGELQLALIARALAQQPKLLLLDEPTSHLDITHQVKILDLIRRLNRKFQLTVLMVLHDLNLAAEYSHRLVLMSGGSVHKAGTPEEVLDYSVIEQVYNTLVVVDKNPLSGKPFVLVVSEDQRRKANPAAPGT